MSKKPFIIVVGLDYAEHSDIALVRAFELASRDAAAEVHVISVLPTVHASPLAPMKAQIEAEAASMRLKGHVEAKLHAFSAALTDPAAKPPRLV
ncbi:MAG TPA: universal stress protein, partial [Polyangiaceae bacterium]|nr:universal stress protein [Polyangiaceae bacterium]